MSAHEEAQPPTDGAGLARREDRPAPEWSPKRLSDIIGQGEAIQRLKSLVALSKERQQHLPHILLIGPEGTGKRTLAAPGARSRCHSCSLPQDATVDRCQPRVILSPTPCEPTRLAEGSSLAEIFAAVEQLSSHLSEIKAPGRAEGANEQLDRAAG
jgi:predicted Ser/Thr protein kinase